MESLATYALVLIVWSGPEGDEAYIVDQGLSARDCAIERAIGEAQAWVEGKDWVLVCEAEGEMM